MILYIAPGKRYVYHNELKQYFALRKKVFCDKLGWVAANPNGIETDNFDRQYCVYILYIDDESGLVGGGVRLMPTTGPTLLHDVWPDMLPNPEDFHSPNIWEATRFCVDETISSRKSSLLNRATLSLTMAVAAFGNSNGISHVVAICETYFFEMCGAYGPKPEIIGKKVDENGLEISCGMWETEKLRSVLTWSQAIIGNAEPVIVSKVA